MIKPTKTAKAAEKPIVETGKTINLSELLSRKPIFNTAVLWIVGDTPLITHAWSHKAKLAMLEKQVRAVKPGKELRNPDQDFVDSLYDMGDGTYGFPATGVKNCILSAAHKDKGIARSAVMSALWLHADMVRVRPALASAICDMPLIRIYGGKPEMREDMVKVGAITKTANLAYRGQFKVWGMPVTIKYNPVVITAEALAFLIQESGIASGLGEWRNERKGMFGAFHLADAAEEQAWIRYARGKGPLPIPASYREAAE
ncbi:MAG: hypothetical protein ABW003_17270 [Microvirga sp.]